MLLLDATAIVLDLNPHRWATAVVVAYVEREHTTGRKRIKRVQNEIREDLPYFSRGAHKLRVVSIVANDVYFSGFDPPAVKSQDFVEQVRDVHGRGRGVVFVKSQRLPGHGCDPAQFLFRHGQIASALAAQSGIAIQQEQQVHDRFQRVVDFVGDGGRESSRRGKFLGVAQGGLHRALFGNV